MKRQYVLDKLYQLTGVKNSKPSEDFANEIMIEIKKLQHYKDSTVGLWATDRPNMLSDSKNNNILFRLDYHE